jgi:hypothetical protein
MLPMTECEQRIAIAEACGWDRDFHVGGSTHWHRGKDTMYLADVPDYLNDLNAMREAKKTLRPPIERIAFMQEIWRITGVAPGNGGSTWDVSNAEAKQEAEAFLRVKGLWKEDESD